MKKFKTLVIVGLAILAVGAVSAALYLNNITRLNATSGGLVVFKYGQKNIEADLSNEDLRLIVKAFDGKLLFKDNPSCGFTEDVAVVLNGAQVFCIACDTCPVFYWKNEEKYFRLSEKKSEQVRTVLEKYGFHFPCI